MYCGTQNLLSVMPGMQLPRAGNVHNDEVFSLNTSNGEWLKESVACIGRSTNKEDILKGRSDASFNIARDTNQNGFARAVLAEF